MFDLCLIAAMIVGKKYAQAANAAKKMYVIKTYGLPFPPLKYLQAYDEKCAMLVRTPRTRHT